MEEKKKPIGLIIGAVIVCILVIAVICVIIILLRSKSNKNNQTNTKESSNEVILLSQEEAEKLIKEYYDIAETLWFLSNDEFDVDNSKYPEPMEIRNYEEIIDKYISKDYKDEFEPALLIKKNGKYYVQMSGFAEGYDNLEFEDIVVKENEISCKVIFSLYVGDKLVEDNVESDFALVLEGDDWKIAEYYSDYMLHQMINPEEAAATYETNEKIELNSTYGKKISDYIYNIWAEPEVYKDCIAEFDDIRYASKDYLAVCAAFDTWSKQSGNNSVKATFDDFNNSLVDIFGENADGLLTKENIENVPFVLKNDDGLTYRFSAIEASETSKVYYSLKSIERKDNAFYVELYEYKAESDLPNSLSLWQFF